MTDEQLFEKWKKDWEAAQADSDAQVPVGLKTYEAIHEVASSDLTFDEIVEKYDIWIAVEAAKTRFFKDVNALTADLVDKGHEERMQAFIQERKDAKKRREEEWRQEFVELKKAWKL